MKKKALLPTLLCFGISLCLLVSMTTFGWAQAKPAALAKPAATAKQPQPQYGGILKIGTAIDSNVLGYPPGMLTTQDFVTSKTCIESLARYDSKGPDGALAGRKLENRCQGKNHYLKTEEEASSSMMAQISTPQPSSGT